MAEPSRRNPRVMLGLLVLAALALLLPRFVAAKMALLELRVYGWLILLAGGGLWLLLTIGRRE